MFIDKDTKIYGSFSKNPGSNGCKFFNNRFKEDGINAIYKSFYSENIEASVFASKILNFSGFAISMPFKREIIPLLDEYNDEVKQINSCNTVVIAEGKLLGYNTDWIGVRNFLSGENLDFLTILGTGAFSSAVQYACNILKIEYKIIDRKSWNEINKIEGKIFNATPVEINAKNLIDGRPHTDTGKKIAELQAIEQYKIYMIHA